jgi:hypothetical protein
MQQRYIFILGLIMLASVVGMAASAAAGRAFTYTQKLTVEDDGEGDGIVYGLPIDIDGQSAMVGAYFGEGIRGAAYYYEQINGQWIEKQRLLASDGVEGDFFGLPAVIDGNRALISSHRAEHGEAPGQIGAVYAFERMNGLWNEKQKIKPVINDEYLYFGRWIALQGNIAFISYINVISASSSHGEVAVYEYQNEKWVQTQIIQAPYEVNEPAYDFGSFPVLNGDIAWLYDPDHKAILGYEKLNSIWTHTITLSDISLSVEYNFWSESDHLIAIERTDNGSQAVAFHRDNGSWTRQQTLSVSETIEPGIYSRWFWVDGEGDRIVLSGGIGPSGLDPEEQSRFFSVWEYQNGTWVETQRTDVEPKSATEDMMEIYAWYGGNTVMTSLFTNPLEDTVYVYTDLNLVPTATPTLLPPTFTHTPGGPTITPEPTATNTPLPDGTVELLVNGGFEVNADSNQSPDGWKLKQASSDKPKCNDGGEPIAYEGLCAFQSKGGDGENSKLQQDVDLAAYPVSAGDILTLGGQVWAKGDVDSKVTLKVKYVSLPTDKVVVDVSPTGNATAKLWTAFSSLQSTLTMSVAETPTEITLQIKNASPSGKVRYDALSLTHQFNTTNLLGLPQ